MSSWVTFAAGTEKLGEVSVCDLGSAYIKVTGIHEGLVLFSVLHIWMAVLKLFA